MPLPSAIVAFCASGDVPGEFHMSNVLIGIIGVILFIGLALAGALFLGPRFQESTNNSKASAAVQMTMQTAAAANLYRLQEGRDTVSTYDVASLLVAKGYMKSVSDKVRLIDVNAQSGSGQAATTALYDLGADDGARDVCKAIERQMGRTTFALDNFDFSSAGLPGTSGCRWNGATHFAYSKM